MTAATRALQLLVQAIREVDTFDELAKLRETAWELYAGDEEVFQELMRELEARTAVLSERLEQGEIFGADDGE